MVALKAGNSNTALTVLRLLLEAIAIYGQPSRARGDRGGENKLAAVFMILKNGLNRGSFLWGSYVLLDIYRCKFSVSFIFEQIYTQHSYREKLG